MVRAFLSRINTHRPPLLQLGNRIGGRVGERTRAKTRRQKRQQTTEDRRIRVCCPVIPVSPSPIYGAVPTRNPAFHSQFPNSFKEASASKGGVIVVERAELEINENEGTGPPRCAGTSVCPVQQGAPFVVCSACPNARRIILVGLGVAALEPSEPVTAQGSCAAV